MMLILYDRSIDRYFTILRCGFEEEKEEEEDGILFMKIVRNFD